MSDWMAAAGGVLGAAGSVASGIMNYQAQQDVLAWQKAAQEKTWQREDTAVQRRTADLRAAGLNPVLAAGGAAQTGSPVQLRAPQLDLGNAGGQLASAASAVQSIHQSQAQVELIRQQAANQAAQREGVELDNQYKAGTLGARTSQTAADASYAVKTLADRVDTAAYKASEAAGQAGIAQAQNLIMGNESRTIDVLTKAGLNPEKLRADLLQAQKAATDQGIEYSKAQTAALAYAVQKSGMDAQVLRDLGIPPIVINAVTGLLETAARLIK